MMTSGRILLWADQPNFNSTNDVEFFGSSSDDLDYLDDHFVRSNPYFVDEETEAFEQR